MTFKLRAVLSVVVLSLLIVMAGCGSGNQITTPTPEGFTNANLNGTYSFSVTGTNAGGFFSFAGSLQANGAGSITGGTIDINSPGTGVQTVNTPLALSGSYSVGSDGRTAANLTTAAGNFTIDFVLLSNSSGLVIRFDNNASASGSLDLQNSSAFSTSALAGTFAFNLSGIDAGGNSDTTVGNFTFNSSGSITTGTQDLNDDGAVLSDSTISGGTVVNPTGGRGTLTLDTSNGALDFAFYVIDPNHIRLVSTDTSPVFSGDAFRQATSFTLSSAFPAGSAAFTLAGASAGSPAVAGGILTADGNGNITSGTEDMNVNNSLTQNIAVSGTYTMANTGRGTLTLAGTNQSFAIYPTMTGGLLMLDLNTAIATGTALQQTGTSFSNSTVTGAYGLNFTGVNLNLGTEVDAVAQFTADGNGNIKGAFDFNNEGALNPSLALTGTYTIGTNGRGTGTLNSSAGTFSVIYYVVSGSKVLFIEADGLQPSVGLFAQQQTM